MNKEILIFTFVSLLATFAYLQTGELIEQAQGQDFEIKQAFENWKLKYGKINFTQSEESYRLSIFRESFLQVLEHSKLKSSYTLGLNKFAAMSDEEFENSILMPTGIDLKHGTEVLTDSGDHGGSLYIKGNVDWRKEGAVNEIQDQGHCGSCYTFATAAACEAASKLQSSYGLQKFSEQQLVSCSQSYGNNGCGGGSGDSTMSYVIQHGILHYKDMPYVSGEAGEVPECPVESGTFYIQSFRNAVGRGVCKGIQEIVRDQPVYGRVIASTWKLYESGIFDNCSQDPNKIGHAITIIGYNTEPEEETERYWLIRNSWGADWGEDGYIKLKFGNTCSVCYEAFGPEF